jgi:hypothetical protein
MSVEFEANSTISDPSDSQDIVSDFEGEVETSTKKRRKPKAKFQRLSKARQLANARERRRAQRIHDGFANLARHVPQEPNEEGRLSRMEILQRAIDYIRHLESLLNIKREGPPPASELQNSVSATSPVTPVSSRQSPSPSVEAVPTPVSSARMQCFLPVTSSVGYLPSPTTNSSSGKVPTTTSTTTTAMESRNPASHLDISGIDFDIDEDLSDILSSPEDVYDDLQSIICTRTDARNSSNGMVGQVSTLNRQPTEQSSSFTPSHLVSYFSHSQQTNQMKSPNSCEMMNRHSVVVPAQALPSFTPATKTVPSHSMGRVSSGAEISFTAARYAASPAVSSVSGKRMQNGFSAQPPAKRIPSMANNLSNGYNHCSMENQLEFKCNSAFPSIGSLFGSVHSPAFCLKPNACSV